MGIEGLRMHSLRLSADYDFGPIPNAGSEVKRQLSRAQVFEWTGCENYRAKNSSTPRTMNAWLVRLGFGPPRERALQLAASQIRPQR